MEEEREKNYDVEVALLAMTNPVEFANLRIFDDNMPISPDAESLIEWASRLCVDKVEDTGVRFSYIQDRMRQGHETVVEHVSMTFYVRCSRVVTHELVRHRIASYSQRSQRYVKEGEPRFITPPEIAYCKEGAVILKHGNLVKDTAIGIFLYVMETCWDAYTALIAAGVPREIARYVLPNACETQIVCTFNLRELLHIIELRTSEKALPEMRVVAGKIKDICKKHAPRVFENL